VSSCPPPYRPLRGADPPHFVDREDPQDFGAAGIVASAIRAYTSGPCDPRFHRLVIGGQAMGKTALLRAISREATRRLGWAIAVYRCRPKERALRPVSTAVWQSMRRQWSSELARSGRGVLTLDHAVQEWVAGCPPAADFGETGPSWATLKQLLEGAGVLSRALSRGLVVMFDDVDRLGYSEVESLGHLARALSRDCLPVAFVFTGGLQLEERFARARNFSGSLWPTRLGELDDSDAREALVVPAADRGVEFQEDALELLCGAACGSPLEVQRLGFAAWSAARDPGLVTAADARDGVSLLALGTTSRAC